MMDRMERAFLFLNFFVFAVFAVTVFGAFPALAKPNPRYASIVIDADSGAVLEQQYADKALHPASLTKIMTLLLLFEALEQGRVDPGDRISISRHAASMAPSKLGLKPGASIRVQDAILSLVTKSANDIAVAVAEHLGHSEKGFAGLMNRKAIEIGMTRTRFTNASGLHDRRQVSTARDMAKLARYVINAYPSYYRYFSRESFSYAGHTYRNHNHLMGRYEGMDGMKTGYVAASGFNLVASAVRNDRRVIAVVFGGRTSKSRNAHMEVLLDRGFEKLNTLRIARAKIPLPAHKPPILQAIAALNKAMPEEGVSGLVGEGDFDPAFTRRMEAGLIAVAAYKSRQGSSVQSARSTVPQNRRQPWSVQVGAFNSRVATDRVLSEMRSTLPPPYSDAQPLIAPLKTQKGWLFRARLTGFTKEEAYAACRYLEECLPVAPR